MNSAGAFFVRWRVRLGYPLALTVLIFCPARASQHSLWRAGRHPWSRVARLGCRVSPQAGSPHGNRTIRLHPQSSLSRERHIGSRRGNSRAFLDFCGNTRRVLRDFLFLSSCARKNRNFARAISLNLTPMLALCLYFSPDWPPQDWEGPVKVPFPLRSTEKITNGRRR